MMLVVELMDLSETSYIKLVYVTYVILDLILLNVTVIKTNKKYILYSTIKLLHRFPYKFILQGVIHPTLIKSAKNTKLFLLFAQRNCVVEQT